MTDSTVSNLLAIAFISFILAFPIKFIFSLSFSTAMILGFFTYLAFAACYAEQYNQKVYERNKKRGFVK